MSLIRQTGRSEFEVDIRASARVDGESDPLPAPIKRYTAAPFVAVEWDCSPEAEAQIARWAARASMSIQRGTGYNSTVLILGAAEGGLQEVRPEDLVVLRFGAQSGGRLPRPHVYVIPRHLARALFTRV